MSTSTPLRKAFTSIETGTQPYPKTTDSKSEISEGITTAIKALITAIIKAVEEEVTQDVRTRISEKLGPIHIHDGPQSIPVEGTVSSSDEVKEMIAKRYVSQNDLLSVSSPPIDYSEEVITLASSASDLESNSDLGLNAEFEFEYDTDIESEPDLEADSIMKRVLASK